VATGVAPITPNTAGTGRLPLFYDSALKYLYLGGSSLWRSPAAVTQFSFTSLKTTVGNLQSIAVNPAATPKSLLLAGDQGILQFPLDGPATLAINPPPVWLMSSSSQDLITTSTLYASGEPGLGAFSAFFGTWRRAVSSPVGFTTPVRTSPEQIYAMSS